MKLIVLLAALVLTSPSVAQEPRHQGYAPLEGLVGSWTIAGKEGSYLETCDWYDGRRHIICNTEAKRKDGSISRGMSILSFVPEQGYVYTGIGNRGRYETNDKKWCPSTSTPPRTASSGSWQTLSTMFASNNLTREVP